MAALLGFFILGFTIILQTTIATRITLLHGPADLVLLVLLAWILRERNPAKWQWGVLAGFMVGLASSIPMWIPILGYFLLTGLTQFLQTRVWQIPILSLFAATVIGTFLINGLFISYIFIAQTPINLTDSFNLIILPSLVLNIFLALPVYGLVGEISNLFYPQEEEV